jgi:hypothetical protein
MLSVKNHLFYIEKTFICEKRENISWNCETLRKNLHEMKLNKLQLKNKTRTKESMVYTTFSTPTKYQHFNVYVYFIDFVSKFKKIFFSVFCYD